MKPTSTLRNNKIWMRLAAALFWLIVWQAGSMLIGREILLVSPVSACKTLVRLMGTKAFYLSVLGSFGRIFLGFMLGTLLALLLAVLSRTFTLVRILLAPLMATIKTIPVASFVILALLWVSSKNLSVLTAFLMVMPIVYANSLTGLDAIDLKLMEMARVFRFSRRSKVRAIYIPAVFPHFLTGVTISLGMCWKAGIAAEVIAQPKNSIGSALQQAKLFFETPELFAWTLAIILLSLLIERGILRGIRIVRKKMEGPAC